MTEQCYTFVNGEKGLYKIVKENLYSFWIALGESSSPRTVMRKEQYSLKNFVEDEYKDLIPVDKKIGIPEEVEVPGHEIIKRHKTKHGFEKV